VADNEEDLGYSDEQGGRLELIWGEGFLSPGGPEEVARIVDGHDVAGCAVLDIGSGAGGVDLALVRNHDAASVVGVEVQQGFVDLASSRAASAGLEDCVSYRLFEPGSLPFSNGLFDVVFSKDAILHEPDKEALYQEAFRVLRPGGHLLVGDWLRGDGTELDGEVASFVEAAGHAFTMASLQEVREIVGRVGFTNIETEDRRGWYLGEATAELDRLRGDMRAEFVERWGQEAAQDEIEFWEVLVASLTSGALSPGHVKARTPTG
jgi:Methylase involved in ubiquinone/menaquinone biosynthesis